jgi:hypothetical protein
MESIDLIVVRFESPRACSCGRLELTSDQLKLARIPCVPITGSFGPFVGLVRGESFVEEQRFPTLALARIASAANLIDVHGLGAILENANGVDLNDAHPTTVAKLKAFARSQSGASACGI